MSVCIYLNDTFKFLSFFHQNDWFCFFTIQVGHLVEKHGKKQLSFWPLTKIVKLSGIVLQGQVKM